MLFLNYISVLFASKKEFIGQDIVKSEIKKVRSLDDILYEYNVCWADFENKKRNYNLSCENHIKLLELYNNTKEYYLYIENKINQHDLTNLEYIHLYYLYKFLFQYLNNLYAERMLQLEELQRTKKLWERAMEDREMLQRELHEIMENNKNG